VKSIEKSLTHIGAFLFMIILFLAFIGVFFRYVLNDSIIWAEEIIRYSFIWMFFLCLPEVTRTGAHISLDYIPSHVHGITKKVIDIAIEIINDIFLLIIIIYGVKITIINMAQGSPALQIPYAYIYFAIPVGGTLMLLSSIQRVYKIIKNETAEA
jgi:TRAP-type C4-dicarboxylate transport system permease small subunit